MRFRTFLLSSLVLAVLGFVLGYFVLYPWLTPAPLVKPPSLTDAPISIDTPDDTAGWCCIVAGALCAPSKSPQLCIGNGGLLYNKTQDPCDKICAYLKNRLP